MPRNRYSSAYLFENRRKSLLRLSQVDDPSMDKTYSAHGHARTSTLPQNFDTNLSKTLLWTEKQATKEIKESQSTSFTGHRKATTRKPVGSGPQVSQQLPGAREDLTSQSADSKGAERSLDKSTYRDSVANDIRQATRNASNISIGRKPPPVAPASAGKPESRRRPSKDTITILGTVLPVDASVNLAYHELLKESNGSDANPAPETLRNSIVIPQQRSVSAQGQLEEVLSKAPAEDPILTSNSLRKSPSKKQKDRPASIQSPPKRQPRDRDAMRKELTALLDPCRRKPLPPEPVIGIPPDIKRTSSQKSSQRPSTSTPTKNQAGREHSMSPIPEPAEVSPMASGEASSRVRRSHSLASTISSPTKSLYNTKRASFSPTSPPPPPSQLERHPSTISPPRSHSSLGLLPSLLTNAPSPSFKKTTSPPQHRYTFSTPSMQDYLSSSSSSASSSTHSLPHVAGANRATESSPESPHSLYLPHMNSTRDLADILPESAAIPPPSPKFVRKDRDDERKRPATATLVGDVDEKGEEEESEDEAQPPPILRAKPRGYSGLGGGKRGVSVGEGLNGFVYEGQVAGGGKGQEVKSGGGVVGSENVGRQRAGSGGGLGGWFGSLRSKVRIGRGK